MKKSQIMAVFALALALGAVAPIAGVMGNASAFTIDDPDTAKNEGKATNADVAAAVAFVNANKAYAAFDAFTAAVEKIQANEADNAPIDEGKYFNLTVATTEAKVNTIKTRVGAIDATKAATIKISADGVTAADLQTALNVAVSVKNYSIYSRLCAAVDDAEHADLKGAIEAYNALVDGADVIDTSDMDAVKANVATNVVAKVNAANGNANAYNNYHAIYEAVFFYKPQLDAYNKGFKAIDAGVKALIAADLLTEAGVTGYNFTLDQSLPEIKNAKQIVLNDASMGGVAASSQSLIVNYAKWNDVKTAMKAMENLTNYSDAYRYGKMITLATEFKDATYPEYASKTPAQVAEIMAGYKAQEEPGTTDTPADADVNAPNTGILSSAEGSATTISIVAGLTTALASLGAGVVAYRSARRGE